MKKLLIILLLISAKSYGAECHHQRNPIGYPNYDVCEVEETGYTCVSLEGKTNSSISCFPTPTPQQDYEENEGDGVRKKTKFIDRKPW